MSRAGLPLGKDQGRRRHTPVPEIRKRKYRILDGGGYASGRVSSVISVPCPGPSNSLRAVSRAFVGLRQLGGDGQANAAAGDLGRLLAAEEPVEDAGQVVVGTPGPVSVTRSTAWPPDGWR